MATGRSNKLVGQVGEFLVCAELGRRGLIATPFAGNVPGYDVIATDERCHSVPIQVKTSNGKKSWQFSGKKYLNIQFDPETEEQHVVGIRRPRHPDLIFVFVWLGQRPDTPDRFFLLTNSALLKLMKSHYRSYLAKHSGRRPVRPESTHMALQIQELEPYEDAWALVEQQLGLSRRKR